MARDRDTSSSRSGGSSRKPKMRASVNPTEVEQYGLADHFDFTILDAWYGPWQMKSKAGEVYDPILALYVEYQIEDEDKPHIEPVGLGSSALKYFIPSETGYEDEFAGDLSREDWLEIANGNIGNYELEELRGGHLLPISTREKLPENTNGDFWFRKLKEVAEANGVELEWTDEQGLRDIGDVLRGLQGHASRLKNSLQKDMDFGEEQGKKQKDRKVLCIVEVSGFERKGRKKSAGRSSREEENEERQERPARTTRRTRDEDDDPAEDTRRSVRRGSSRDEEDESEPRSRGRAPAGRGRGREADDDDDAGDDRDDRKPARHHDRGGKKPSSGPDLAAIVKDRDFISAYFDEVIPKIESTKGKKVQRAGLVEISDFDDQEWSEAAFELATSDDKWVIDWWGRRREVDYDDEDGMVRLAK